MSAYRVAIRRATRDCAGKAWRQALAGPLRVGGSSTRRRTKIQATHTVETKEHGQNGLIARRAESHRVAVEGFANVVAVSFELDLAAGADGANEVNLRVLNLGESFGVAARTGLVARDRRDQADGFVRADVVVDMAPVIEGNLGIIQCVEAAG